jgi:hypothetical protein
LRWRLAAGCDAADGRAPARDLAALRGTDLLADFAAALGAALLAVFFFAAALAAPALDLVAFFLDARGDGARLALAFLEAVLRLLAVFLVEALAMFTLPSSQVIEAVAGRSMCPAATNGPVS